MSDHEEMQKHVERFYDENNSCVICGHGSDSEIILLDGTSIFYCHEHAPHKDDEDNWRHSTLDMNAVSEMICLNPIRSTVRFYR